MMQIDLSEQEPSVRRFLESLLATSEDIHVRVNGKTVLRILPPNVLDADERQTLIERRRQLMRRARQRIREVPDSDVARAIQEAIDEVRIKQRRHD